MAKHVIIESYTFTPTTNTVVVTGKNIRREQLMLITNVTANVVIYNFSDPSLGFSGYTNTVNSVTGLETTTIVLDYNCGSMSSTDKLSILTEESYQEITPSEILRDPVDKLRVSTPQSLIDTDFEYGIQQTKWESLNLLNNRPSAFYDVTVTLPITAISVATKAVTVSCATPPAVGTPIFVQGTFDGANADGWWIVDSIVAGTSFTFSTTTAPAATLYDSNKTYIFAGTFFTGSVIPAGTTALTFSGTTITVSCTGAHGLRVGDGIYVTGTTATTNPPNGSWTVATTPTVQSFTFVANAAPTGTISSVTNGSLYPRALGFVQHRAFDGGVQFSNVVPYHGYQVIRQTRRQFRYQSGKAMQFSTGSILKPQVQPDTLTAAGNIITVTTKYPHGLSVGTYLQIIGATESQYNGVGDGTYYTVTSVTNNLTFTYLANGTPANATASGFPISVSPYLWWGSANRVGLFDQQNGIFFEYDGQQLYVVKRSSTAQISGNSTVTSGSALVSGTSTKFSQQLKQGDYIVIRGMSYLVQAITSDTGMYIYPEYRGVTGSGTVISKTIDTKYPQSQWNIDRMDGTGASLFNLDLTKMQMFYIDYSWYGAGAVRFGFKNNRGEVIYAHRIPNNNVNTEAYMRSGNLPARYETNTIAPRTYLTATLTSGVTTFCTVADTSGFPSAGTLVLQAASNTSGAIEYITYTGKTATTFTGLTRNATGGTSSATTFTVTGLSTASAGGTAPISVELYSPTQASTVSHWGSSVIMDGGFDDDKSFVFTSGMTANVANIAASANQPLISLRIAPSVDNGQTGVLGSREIINRMQLVFRSLGIFASGAGAVFLITLKLNGRLSGGTFAAVGGSSLSQVAFHTAGQTITGGETVYGFYVDTSQTITQSLDQVRDIGNSILGGGTSLTVPTTANNVFPDGPDMVTICAQNVSSVSTNTITARISWTEAQA